LPDYYINKNYVKCNCSVGVWVCWIYYASKYFLFWKIYHLPTTNYYHFLPELSGEYVSENSVNSVKIIPNGDIIEIDDDSVASAWANKEGWGFVKLDTNLKNHLIQQYLS